MFFYMFGMDVSQPETCARQLARLGMHAVVGPADRRCIDAIRENGMRAYVCTGAFPLSDGDRKCVDVDGVERVWFSSGCPNDDGANLRREDALFHLARTEGLSGVFIDGARFASPASAEDIEALFTCFCPSCMERMEEMGFDPEAIRSGVRNWRDGRRELPPAEWLIFRRQTVDGVMTRFVQTVKRANSALKTGAFVFPASLGALVGQTPSVCDAVDIAAPMLYRRYTEPSGPATLNHEYAAMVRAFGIERTHQLTGVNPPDRVLENGFPPEALATEIRRSKAPLLVPILQLNDDRLSQSITAIRDGGAQGAGFFLYRPDFLRYLPDLRQF